MREVLAEPGKAHAHMRANTQKEDDMRHDAIWEIYTFAKLFPADGVK